MIFFFRYFRISERIYNIIESEMIEIVKNDKSIFVLNENSLFYGKNY